jgi:hypothetical protein
VNSTTSEERDRIISEITIKLSRLIDGEIIATEERADDLSQLGLSQLDHFDLLGELTDIDDCISTLQMAVQLHQENQEKTYHP